MSQSIGILGSGVVGQTLAAGFVRHGHPTMIGTRSPAKLADWQGGEGAGVEVGSLMDAATFGTTIVLAVKGTQAETALNLAGAEFLDGKTIIDATNPISDDAPENGVLRFFTGPNESLMERLQRNLPGARFVKAFNSIGSACMVNPKFAGGMPTMFICGNHEQAKAETSRILGNFGFEVEDMGSAEAARAIEPLCMLWCILGFQHNQWNHAFKLLKA